MRAGTERRPPIHQAPEVAKAWACLGILGTWPHLCNHGPNDNTHTHTHSKTLEHGRQRLEGIAHKVEIEGACMLSGGTTVAGAVKRKNARARARRCSQRRHRRHTVCSEKQRRAMPELAPQVLRRTARVSLCELPHLHDLRTHWSSITPGEGGGCGKKYVSGQVPRKYSQMTRPNINEICVENVSPNSPKNGQCGPNMINNWTGLTKSGLILSNVDPEWPGFGRIWRSRRGNYSQNTPGSVFGGKSTPRPTNSTNTLPSVAEFDEMLARCGECSPNSAGRLWGWSNLAAGA